MQTIPVTEGHFQSVVVAEDKVHVMTYHPGPERVEWYQLHTIKDGVMSPGLPRPEGVRWTGYCLFEGRLCAQGKVHNDQIMGSREFRFYDLETGAVVRTIARGAGALVVGSVESREFHKSVYASRVGSLTTKAVGTERHVCMTGHAVPNHGAIAWGPSKTAELMKLRGLRRNRLVVYNRLDSPKVFKLDHNPIHLAVESSQEVLLAFCRSMIYRVDLD